MYMQVHEHLIWHTIVDLKFIYAIILATGILFSA